MNQKKATVAEAVGYGQDIEISVEGLEAQHDGTFRLKNVPVIDVPWPDIAQVLIGAGVSERDAHVYTDDFADTVFQRELAKVFAQRTRRVS